MESISYFSDLVSYYTFSFLNKLNLRAVNGVELGPYICLDEGAQVTDDIYIGSLSTATNDTWLRKNNISMIINLSGTDYPSQVPTATIRMADEPIDCDHMSEYLHKFAAGVELIKTARARDKRVLIHCAAGINRSAALIAFYLIECGFSYGQAVDMLTAANKQRGRPVLTNLSFRYLLCARHGFKHFDTSKNNEWASE